MRDTEMRQIKASAGSGKTWTLTRAYLERLKACPHTGKGRHVVACSAKPDAFCPPEAIIAITFTNAAATEMRQRILGDLKKAVLGADGAPPIGADEAHFWLQHVLHNANALNVRTIDSLLHLIVRSAALVLGIPPDYQPAFSTPEMMADALTILLEEAQQEEGQQAQNTASGQGQTSSLALLRSAFEALATYGNTSGFLAGDKIERDLGLLLDDILQGTFDNLTDFATVRNAYDGIVQQWQQAAQTLLGTAKQTDFSSNAFKFLSHVQAGNLPQAENSAFFRHTDPSKFFLKKTTISREMADAFASYLDACRAYMDKGFLFKLALRTAPFIALGKRLHEVFVRSPESFKLLPNSRIPVYVQGLLSAEQGVPEALCRLGNRLTHYLVDEFQDTSQSQWDALAPLVHEALSRGGSFTWVGDVKQSIYSWRGGNATLFDNILEMPPLNALGKAQKESLPYNRRSRSTIVSFNNDLFAPLAQQEHAASVLSCILPENAPHAVALAVPKITQAFAACAQQMPTLDNKKENGGLVSVVCTDKEMLFSRLVEKIQLAHATHSWSKMLVLVPFHRVGSAVAEELVAANIPVVTENSLLLGKHPLIIQTVALMQFLQAPQNDTALWTVILGEMAAEIRATCHVTVDELVDWCANRGNGQNLHEQLPLAWPSLWKTLLEPIVSQAPTLTPYELTMAWYAHTKAEHRFPDASLFLRRFLEVVFMAESRNILSLSAFLELWESEHAEEKVPMPESMDAVRVMTIHKSKGLEAPVVFMPWTTMKAKIHNAILAKEVGGLNIAVPLQKGVEPEFSQDLARSACELLHLLYVAFTRAKDALFVFHEPDNEALLTMFSKSGIADDSDIGTMPPATNERQKEVTGELGSEKTEMPATCSGDKPEIRIFHNAQAQPPFANERGKFIHFCLEHVDATMAGCSPETANDIIDQALPRYPGPYGAYLANNEEEERLSLLKALLWFVAQPETANWLNCGIPEISLVDAKGRAYRVDLLVRQEDRVLVLDYKTGEIDDDHIRQVRNYLSIVSRTGETTSECLAVLIYLDKQQFRVVNATNASPLCDKFSQCLALLGA